MDARARSASESTVGNAVASPITSSGTSMITVTVAGTGPNANTWMDTVVGVNIATVTTVTATTAPEPDEKSNDEDCAQVPIFDEAATDGGRLPDVVAESKIYGVTGEDEPIESYLAITIQVFIPFLIAGLGMVGAGLVLDLVQVRPFNFYVTVMPVSLDF